RAIGTRQASQARPAFPRCSDIATSLPILILILSSMYPKTESEAERHGGRSGTPRRAFPTTLVGNCPPWRSAHFHWARGSGARGRRGPSGHAGAEVRRRHAQTVRAARLPDPSPAVIRLLAAVAGVIGVLSRVGVVGPLDVGRGAGGGVVIGPTA